MFTELTTEVPPIALLGTDVIVRDPDHPDTVVHWPITALGRESGVVVAEYALPDGGEGRHAFEKPEQQVTVLARPGRALGAAA